MQNRKIVSLGAVSLLMLLAGINVAMAACGDGTIDSNEECDYNSPFGGACSGKGGYCGNDCKCGTPPSTSAYQCIQPTPPPSPAKPTNLPKPDNAVTCPGSDSGLSANTVWTSVGTSASGCNGGKCQYYVPSTDCSPNCSCASSTCTGSTCNNGCGGTCQGAKSCGSGGGADTSGYKSLTQVQYSVCQDYNSDGYCTGYVAHPTGYKNLYAPGDVCDDSSDPSRSCAIRANILNCTNMAASNGRQCSYSNSSLSMSKFYLPPGTTHAEITIFNSQEAGGDGIYNFVAIARFGEPPQGNYDKTTNPTTSAPASSLSDITGKDYVVGCSGGITDVFSGALNSNTGQENFPGGWVYVKFIEKRAYFLSYSVLVQLDKTKYTNWYNSATWQSDGDPAESSSNNTNTNIDLPTGPDCASKVCLGNSCWNGTQYIEGQKTQGCATGSAQTSPSSITPISENPPQEVSYITWASNNASKTDAGCTGPTYIAKGGWYNNNAEWYEASKSWYAKPSGAPDGYPAWFHVGVSGTEICTFYPTNSSDGLPGTPYSATIQVLGKAKCGNNILEEGEQCDYNPTASNTNTSYVPCPQGQTCNNCQCTTANSTTPVCQPDDPSCANNTCNDVYCFDGCNYQKGTQSCTGRK